MHVYPEALLPPLYRRLPAISEPQLSREALVTVLLSPQAALSWPRRQLRCDEAQDVRGHQQEPHAAPSARAPETSTMLRLRAWLMTTL